MTFVVLPVHCLTKGLVGARQDSVKIGAAYLKCLFYFSVGHLLLIFHQDDFALLHGELVNQGPSLAIAFLKAFIKCSICKHKHFLVNRYGRLLLAQQVNATAFDGSDAIAFQVADTVHPATVVPNVEDRILHRIGSPIGIVEDAFGHFLQTRLQLDDAFLEGFVVHFWGVLHLHDAKVGKNLQVFGGILKQKKRVAHLRRTLFLFQKTSKILQDFSDFRVM